MRQRFRRLDPARDRLVRGSPGSRGNRCSASASAPRCSHASSARGCSATRTGAARSAISRSGRRLRATASAPSAFRAASINGIPRLRSADGRRIARHRRPGLPHPGLSIRQPRFGVAVPPGSHLPHDVQVDFERAERLTRPGAQQRPGHLDGWFQHDGRVAAWLEALLPAWLDGRLGDEGCRRRTTGTRA